MEANPNSPMDEAPQVPVGASSPVGNEIQRPEPPRKKRKKKLWIILGLVILAVLVFNPFSLIFLSVFVGMGHIKIIEAKLQKPAVYEPVAERLAIYCQSDQSLFPKILSYAWLPGEVSRLGHPWCEIATNFASVEMGGGFYHFGYTLELDETASTPAKNVWQAIPQAQLIPAVRDASDDSKPGAKTSFGLILSKILLPAIQASAEYGGLITAVETLQAKLAAEGEGQIQKIGEITKLLSERLSSVIDARVLLTMSTPNAEKFVGANTGLESMMEQKPR